jgi:hypothetical protein
MKRAGIALLLALIPFAAHARPSPYPPVTQYDGDRISARQAQMNANELGRAVKAKQGAKPRQRQHRRHYRKPAPGYVAHQRAPVVRQIAAAEGMTHEAPRVIGGRPQGCPHRFCACALALKIFGRIVPSLNLAANWARKFERVAAAPGMVAARRGHAFQLLAHIRGSTWRVWDANSGHGRIRIHPRSIAGYVIVNPHGRG